MPSKRTGYAPWSLTREAGVQSATVDGTIEVPQYLQPTIDTGFVDYKGNWKGRKSSDEGFIGFTKGEGIPNSGTVLFPDTDLMNSISMVGFNDIFIAIKPSGGGDITTQFVMGPDTNSYNNLRPVNAAALLRYKSNPDAQQNQDYVDVFNDGQESMTGAVWNIYQIQDRARNWENFQIKLTNVNAGNIDVEMAFKRMV